MFINKRIKKRIIIVLIFSLFILPVLVVPVRASDNQVSSSGKSIIEKGKKIKELLDKYEKTSVIKYNRSIVDVYDKQGKPIDVTLRLYYSDQVQERVTTGKGHFNNVFNHGSSVPKALLGWGIEKHPKGMVCLPERMTIRGPKFLYIDAEVEKLKKLLEDEVGDDITDKAVQKILEEFLKSLGWAATNVNLFVKAFDVGKDLATPVKEYLEKKFEEIFAAAKDQNKMIDETLGAENQSLTVGYHGGWAGPFRKDVGIVDVELMDGWFGYHEPVTEFKYDIVLNCREGQPPIFIEWYNTSEEFVKRKSINDIIKINYGQPEPAKPKKVSLIKYQVLDKKVEVAMLDDIDLGTAGLTPKSNFYFLDIWSESLSMMLSFKLEKDLSRGLSYMKERISEMQLMVRQDDLQSFNIVKDKYLDLWQITKDNLNKIKEDDWFKQVAQINGKYNDLLLDIYGEVPENDLLTEFIPELVLEEDLILDSPEVEQLFGKDEKLPEAIGISEIKKEDELVDKIIDTAKKEDDNNESSKIEVVCGNGVVQISEECDPPGDRAQCYEGEVCNDICLCEYIPVEAVCGNNKIDWPEICDGTQFSQQCIDSSAVYLESNPNLKLRCFNECQGCEVGL